MHVDCSMRMCAAVWVIIGRSVGHHLPQHRTVHHMRQCGVAVCRMTFGGFAVAWKCNQDGPFWRGGPAGAEERADVLCSFN